MAIRLNTLEQLSKIVETKRYIFKDLYLDVERDNSYNTITEQNISKNDIKAWYDLDAVFTSLRNLFTTRPGQRFLFPLYGLDLREFLFEPINEITAREMGERISKAIKDYEPRVNLVVCRVVGKPDENTYQIDVVIELPVFKTVSTINIVLDVKTEKFIFLT